MKKKKLNEIAGALVTAGRTDLAELIIISKYYEYKEATDFIHKHLSKYRDTQNSDLIKGLLISHGRGVAKKDLDRNPKRLAYYVSYLLQLITREAVGDEQIGKYLQLLHRVFKSVNLR